MQTEGGTEQRHSAVEAHDSPQVAWGEFGPWIFSQSNFSQSVTWIQRGLSQPALTDQPLLQKHSTCSPAACNYSRFLHQLLDKQLPCNNILFRNWQAMRQKNQKKKTKSQLSSLLIYVLQFYESMLRFHNPILKTSPEEQISKSTTKFDFSFCFALLVFDSDWSILFLRRCVSSSKHKYYNSHFTGRGKKWF